MKFFIPLYALLLSACVATTQTTAERETFIPEQWQSTYDNFHYAPAVRAGDYVYLSGVIAAPQSGDAGMADAFERAFSKISDILKAAGTDWPDVVEIVSYHTDARSQIGAFSGVKDRWVPKPYPAWTVIDIDGLLDPSGLVEIKVIAYAPK